MMRPGYAATAETLACVEREADRDLLDMDRRLWSWIPVHVVGTGVDLDEFRRRLEPWLRTAAARRLFAWVMAELRGGAGPGPKSAAVQAIHDQASRQRLLNGCNRSPVHG